MCPARLTRVVSLRSSAGAHKLSNSRRKSGKSSGLERFFFSLLEIFVSGLSYWKDCLILYNIYTSHCVNEARACGLFNNLGKSNNRTNWNIFVDYIFYTGLTKVIMSDGLDLCGDVSLQFDRHFSHKRNRKKKYRGWNKEVCLSLFDASLCSVSFDFIILHWLLASVPRKSFHPQWRDRNVYKNIC